MKLENDLGNDPIGPLVRRIAIPSMLAQFVSVLYSIVDRIYISNIADIGEVALAGVGVCGPVVTMIGAFASLIGIGGAPLMSIRMYIQSVLDSNKNKEEVDRAVKDGDVVDIKYVGKKDGVEFDNGSSDSYELTIGSNTFIDGFEDGVIGMKKDETKDLNLTFPEDYNNTDLAGADVVFTVTVNHVYEETDAVLDDAFVAARNIDGVSTVEEYRQYVYDNLMSSAKSQQETELERNVLEAVTANATFKETPEEMVSRYYDRLVKNLTTTASMYGIDLETFMAYSYGLAADEYEDELQKSAQSAAEQILVMQAIAEKEGLTLTDEELQADLESSASEYGYDSVEAYEEAVGDLRGYKEYLMSEKVTKYLIENANVTETEASTEEATEETTETETETTTETATEAE